MRRWQTPYKLRWAALAIICIVEFFPMESTVVEKDIPYAACVIFLVLLLYELVRQMHKGNGMNRVQMAGYVLACIGTAGFRNEGIYLVLVSGIAVTFYVMHTWWKEDRRKCRQSIADRAASGIAGAVLSEGIASGLRCCRQRTQGSALHSISADSALCERLWI